VFFQTRFTAPHRATHWPSPNDKSSPRCGSTYRELAPGCAMWVLFCSTRALLSGIPLGHLRKENRPGFTRDQDATDGTQGWGRPGEGRTADARCLLVRAAYERGCCPIKYLFSTVTCNLAGLQLFPPPARTIGFICRIRSAFWPLSFDR